MVVRDEDSSEDSSSEFCGFDDGFDDGELEEHLQEWFQPGVAHEVHEGDGASSAQSYAAGMAFAHQGHDQSPSKGSIRKAAKSAVHSPPIRRSIPSKQISTDQWVEKGAALGFISEEFQSIPLLHPDMQRSWVDMQPPLLRARASLAKIAGSAATAASTAEAAVTGQPSVGDGSEDQTRRASTTEAVEPPGLSTKKEVRHCEHRVGLVPTLREDNHVGFMVMGKTVEDLEQLMKSRGGRQGACCLLWNGDRARGTSLDPRTTSAKWVCKTDVMLFTQQQFRCESKVVESLCQTGGAGVAIG